MVILGTAKCDQTSMGTDVMCKSSQLVYNYLINMPHPLLCFVRWNGLSPEEAWD